jgi:alkylation response protein AidB-like acyl-CoA dehydrogenase
VQPGDPHSVDDWRAAARSLVERHLRPIAGAIDRQDRVPETVVAELAAGGFLGLGIPPAWDGRGGDARVTAAVLEEIASASAAVAVLVAVHLSVCSAPILTWGTDGQKEAYLRGLARGTRIGAFALTEPGAGSDAAGLRTRYAAGDGGYVLTGSKMFISNAVSAGVVVLFATKDPALGHRGISAFIVPPGTAGFSVAQRLDKLGLRGSETTELVLDGVRLPPDALLGPEGSGLKIALASLAGGRVGIAACALGVARAAFDELRGAVARDDEPWKRHLLARAYAELAAARALVESAAARKDAGLPYVLEASVAKLTASRAAVWIASAGVDVAGARGVAAGAEPQRLLRDARVFPLVEGTTEVQELVIARRLLDDAGAAAGASSRGPEE